MSRVVICHMRYSDSLLIVTEQMFDQSTIVKMSGLSRSGQNVATLLAAAHIDQNDNRIAILPGKGTQWTRELTKLVCAANIETRPRLKSLYDQIVREDHEIIAEHKRNEDNATQAALNKQLLAEAERASDLGVNVPFELTLIADKSSGRTPGDARASWARRSIAL